MWTLGGGGGGDEKRHVDAGGGGNFDSLMKIFNILKSSIQSIQNPALS